LPLDILSKLSERATCYLCPTFKRLLTCSKCL